MSMRVKALLKLVALLALLSLSVQLLAACGSTSAQEGTANGGSGSQNKGPFTIGVANGFVSSEWRTQMIQDLQSVNAEYKQAGLTKDLVIESGDVDVQGQIQQIRNLISKGVNAIIIDANSPTGLNAVIKEAQKAGIIVICVDQEVTAPEATNVVINQTEWARMSARWLVQKLNGKGNVVVINGVAGHPANEARYSGVKEIFGQNPNIKVLNVLNANWDQATGQQKMADLLASQPNIDGVWSQDGGMAEGALQALATANPAKWPVMVGEARAGYLQLWSKVKQTHPSFTSYSVINPPGIGASGLRVAVEMLQGKKIKDNLLKGANNTTLYVPIPGEVNENNFSQLYNQYKDKANAYTLDGMVSQSDAQGYFK